MLQTEPTYVKKGEITEEIPPNPYLWLSQDKQDIYYQDGEFYKGRGEQPIEYKDVPNWFWVIARKSYGKEILEKWGIILPENRVKTVEEREVEIVAKATELWKCDVEGCNKEVPMTGKGAHIMGHKRKAKSAKKAETVEV